MQGQSVEVFIWLQFLQQSQNKAPWEILFAAQIIPWSTGHNEFAEKETQLWHFVNFLNLGCVRHRSTKAVLSSSLMSCLLRERETVNSMPSCISPTQLHVMVGAWQRPVLLKLSGCVLLLTKGSGYFSEPAMLLHTRMTMLFLYIFMHLQFLPLSVYVLAYSK